MSIIKFLSTKLGKIISGAAALIGVGLSGTGINLALNAKKKNKIAYTIQEKALSKHEMKLKETNNIIANLGIEEKKALELIGLFMELTEKINKCPSINEIDSKINLPSFNPLELKKMSNGLDMALAGVGGGVVSALPGLVFCGASLSVLGFGVLGGGVVLSIKGSKLSKQAVKNVKQAKKIDNEVDNIIEFYKQVDGACIKLMEAIKNINVVYKKKLDILKNLVDRKNDYETYSKNEKTLVRNIFKLTKLLANMCKTKLAKREEEAEVINKEELELIVEKAKIICKETRQEIFRKVFS